MELLSLLLAALADTSETSHRHARLQELRGRLGELPLTLPLDAWQRVQRVLALYPQASRTIRALIFYHGMGEGWMDGHRPRDGTPPERLEPLLGLLPWLAATSLRPDTRAEVTRDYLEGWTHPMGSELKPDTQAFLRGLEDPRPVQVRWVRGERIGEGEDLASLRVLVATLLDDATDESWSLWYAKQDTRKAIRLVRDRPRMAMIYARDRDYDKPPDWSPFAASKGEGYSPYGAQWVRFLGGDGNLEVQANQTLWELQSRLTRRERAAVQRQKEGLRPETRQEIHTRDEPDRNREDIVLLRLLQALIGTTMYPHAFTVEASTQLNALSDWVETARPPNLFSLSLPEAIREAAAWHGQYKTKGYRGVAPLGKEDRDELRWADGGRIVRLLSRRGMENEGIAMNHCVASHLGRVREDRTRVYSYRDATNVPQATVEVESGVTQLTVLDLEGPGNGDIVDLVAARRMAYFLRWEAENQKTFLQMSPRFSGKAGFAMSLRRGVSMEDAMRQARERTALDQNIAAAAKGWRFLSNFPVLSNRLGEDLLFQLNRLGSAGGSSFDLGRTHSYDADWTLYLPGGWPMSLLLELYARPTEDGGFHLGAMIQDAQGETRASGQSTRSWLDLFVATGLLEVEDPVYMAYST